MGKYKINLFEKELDIAEVLNSIYYRNKNFSFFSEDRKCPLIHINTFLKKQETIGFTYRKGIVFKQTVFMIRFKVSDLVGYENLGNQVNIFISSDLRFQINLYNGAVFPVVVDKSVELVNDFIKKFKSNDETKQ